MRKYPPQFPNSSRDRQRACWHTVDSIEAPRMDAPHYLLENQQRDRYSQSLARYEPRRIAIPLRQINTSKVAVYFEGDRVRITVAATAVACSEKSDSQRRVWRERPIRYKATKTTSTKH